MNTPPSDIHPELGKNLSRDAKEALLGQRGKVIWLYGLSGSGKSTLTRALERKLHGEGIFTQILDGDIVRSGLNRDLGFSDADRSENIRRVAEVAKLLKEAGIVTLASFITPTQQLRTQARTIVGSEDFIEIYLKCSFEKCAERDVKGLYKKAKEGKIKDFTGHKSAFEEPETPDLKIDTERNDPETCLEQIYNCVIPKITLSLQDG